MTNLLTPLKKLGKKLTGKDIAGTNLVTVVDDIANKYDGSGGGGGGGEALIVTEVTEGTRGTLNYTYNQIKEALLSGKTVIVDQSWESGEYFNCNYSCILGYAEGGDSHQKQYTVASSSITWIINDPDGYPFYSYD